jgi:hypothetical protein
MKMKNLIWMLGVVVVLASCNSKTSTSEQQVEVSYDSFGEQIDDSDAVDVASLSEMLTNQDSAVVKLTATVDEVCQMKGCWMTIKNESGDPVRVTFKDYGFFVPKDIAGRQIVIEGVAKNTVLEPDVAKHYAEDAGQPYDSTKTYEEIAFIAQGVLVASAADAVQE